MLPTRTTLPKFSALLALVALLAPAGSGPPPAWADPCPEEPAARYYTGGGQTVCPCFVIGEEAGTAFGSLPAGHFPIEVLRVGIGWSSQIGDAPPSLEEAVKFYASGLPTPGDVNAPLYQKLGPVLTDGFINEFNFEPDPGELIINTQPFTVTLEFANQNANDIFAPSVVHDGNGCQSPRNVVYAIPGGWLNACSAGIGGDWIFYVIYRPVNCGVTGVGDTEIAASVPAFLAPPRPNPFWSSTEIEFFVAREERVTLAVYNLAGARVAGIVDRVYGAGKHLAPWDGRDEQGARLASGVYFLEMRAGEFRTTRKLIVQH